MTAARRVGVVAAVVAAVLGMAARAEAGAPNYECSIGKLQIGIDQHRRAGLVRTHGGMVEAMPFVDSYQNGSALDISAQINGVVTRVAVTRYGAKASYQTVTDAGNGACAFIPGDFALGQVTSNLLVLRRDPDDASPVVATMKQQSLVWSSGRYDEVRREMRGTDEWAKFRVVLRVRGGALAGGPEQVGMGQLAGLAGRSTLMEGWGRVADVVMLGPPGP